MSKTARRIGLLSSLLSFPVIYFAMKPDFALAACPEVPSDCCTNTALGCIRNDPASLVNQILQIAIGMAGGVAFLLLVYGGFRMVLSQGNPEALQGAREVITGALTGLLIIIFAVFLLRLIGINILGLPI